MKARTPKALGLLLTYPEADFIEALPGIKTILSDENWLSGKSLKGIENLISYMQNRDLMDLQAEYVALFDRTPSLDLYLFEHIHGDSRKRGQALWDLNNVYEEAGLLNETEHTPDYLPLFLEYLSVQPLEKARDELASALNVIAIIGERLKKRESPYSAVFAALEDISATAPDEKTIQEALKASSGRLPTQEEMDEAWKEQFAFADDLQTDGSGCPKAEDMLARMEEAG